MTPFSLICIHDVTIHVVFGFVNSHLQTLGHKFWQYDGTYRAYSISHFWNRVLCQLPGKYHWSVCHIYNSYFCVTGDLIQVQNNHYHSLEKHVCWILFTDKAQPAIRRRGQIWGEKYCLVVWKPWQIFSPKVVPQDVNRVDAFAFHGRHVHVFSWQHSLPQRHGSPGNKMQQWHWRPSLDSTASLSSTTPQPHHCRNPGNYHWRDLAQVSLSWQNASFVATKVCLPWQKKCRNKIMVCCKKYFCCCNKHIFVTTKVLIMCHKGCTLDGAYVPCTYMLC